MVDEVNYSHTLVTFDYLKFDKIRGKDIMPDSLHQSPLYPITNPGSIVFFGASNRFSAMGTHQLNSLLSSGFEGKIYPIHPKERRVLDLKAYQGVQELPEIPDLASQSGSFITQMFGYLRRFGLGFSSGISVGNEANLDIVDCMAHLADCPHTRVIGLYIETIRRGRKFIDAARSIVRRKPIVAFYVGGSEAGKRAGLSHTGALAGPDALYDGVFRQSGVIRAHSMSELFDDGWFHFSKP